MRKVVFERYGSPEVLDVVECDEPQPDRDEIRIRIHASTVTTADARMRRGEPRWMRPLIGFTRPRRRCRTLGTEYAGVIDAVGDRVIRFRPGDAVFGSAGWSFGANADQLCVAEGSSVLIKPGAVPFGQAAAAVDGATTALHLLRERARLRAGQRILIIDAASSLGTFAVQLAKHVGAEVTGVCASPNVELVHALGADYVLDDLSGSLAEHSRRSGKRWDVVFDTVGASSFGDSRAVLTDHGVFVPAVSSVRSFLDGVRTSRSRGQRSIGGGPPDRVELLQHVAGLLADHALRVVVDSAFPLDHIRDAHARVDSGHLRGKVTINVHHGTEMNVHHPTGA